MAKIPKRLPITGSFQVGVTIPKGSPVYLTGDMVYAKIRPRRIPRWLWRRIKRWYPTQPQPVMSVGIPPGATSIPVGIALDQDTVEIRFDDRKG